MRTALRPYPVQVSPVQLQAMIAQVVARVGGLGFLDGLIPPNSHEFTDVLVNADGRVWGRRKSAMHFEDLQLRPSKDEVWRAVEALLAPEGRACSESTPSVDVKIPRNRELGFGGARVKTLHPIIAPGDGYPSLALRLFEPEPVEPAVPQVRAVPEIVEEPVRVVVERAEPPVVVVRSAAMLRQSLPSARASSRCRRRSTPSFSSMSWDRGVCLTSSNLSLTDSSVKLRDRVSSVWPIGHVRRLDS